jgi:hypothetical protein
MGNSFIDRQVRFCLAQNNPETPKAKATLTLGATRLPFYYIFLGCHPNAVFQNATGKKSPARFNRTPASESYSIFKDR